MELEKLIQSVDLLDYVSQFTEFTKRGDEYWALSPLKEEKTPSFSIRKEKNEFYDFSTGIGGGILTFIMKYFKVGYAEAVNKLKQYAHYDGDITQGNGDSAHGARLEASNIARRFSKPQKAENRQKSTVLPPDYMTRYEKRDDKLDIWRKEGISDVSLERFQVRYDPFSNRIVYPILSTDGEIVNVGGRTLNPDYKEKGLGKYTYFMSWGEMNTIYGYAENAEYIRKQHEIILFEGCKSVLIADSWGIRNTGALLTSHLNKNQLKILIQLGCNVVFALDKDVKPWEDRNICKLVPYVKVEYIHDSHELLEEKDSPVDKGLGVWKKLYDERRIVR